MAGWRELWQRYDVSLRLLALVLAVVLWLVARASPPTELTLPAGDVWLSLELLHAEDGLRVAQAPAAVRVRLRGPGGNPGGAGALRAWVDLEGLGPGSHWVPVQVQVPAGLRVEAVDPVVVLVALEAVAPFGIPHR